MSNTDNTLDNKIADLITQIKKQPSDNNLRLALIQYYCLTANWTKALSTTKNYLNINSKDENSKVLLEANIKSEMLRDQVFSGEVAPMMYPDCDEDMFNRQKSLLKNYIQSVDARSTTELFLETYDRVELTHTINSAENQSVSGSWVDSDVRTAYVLEVFLQEHYYWIPFNNIIKITFKDNEYLTDILWRRGEIHLTGDRVLPAFLPARYAVTDNDISDELKLCQKTHWQDYGDLHTASGQKTLTNGEDDVSILDIIQIEQDKA